jgi:hypothetical protein
VVPRLNSLGTPPTSSGGTFALPPRQTVPAYVPDSQYAYLEQARSYPSPHFTRVNIFLPAFSFSIILEKDKNEKNV